jgi:hypothetical protein
MKTAKQRLAHYRREAASTLSLTWRDTLRMHKSPLAGPCVNAIGENGERYADRVDQLGEYVGDAHNLVSRLPQGWYADNWQDSIIVGGVVRVRSPRGTLYVPVTHCTDWDGATYHMSDAVNVPRGSGEADHSDAKREAARLANCCAEIIAEKERDFQARDAAEQDIAEARDAIHTINGRALVLIRSIRANRANGTVFDAPICDALRAQLRSMLVERAEQFRIIAERQANYWSVVSS